MQLEKPGYCGKSGQKPYRCGGNRSCSAREKSAGTERRDLTKPCSARSWDSYREEDLWGFMDIFEHVVA